MSKIKKDKAIERITKEKAKEIEEKAKEERKKKVGELRRLLRNRKTLNSTRRLGTSEKNKIADKATEYSAKYGLSAENLAIEMRERGVNTVKKVIQRLEKKERPITLQTIEKGIKARKSNLTSKAKELTSKFDLVKEEIGKKRKSTIGPPEVENYLKREKGYSEDAIEYIKKSKFSKDEVKEIEEKADGKITKEKIREIRRKKRR